VGFIGLSFLLVSGQYSLWFFFLGLGFLGQKPVDVFPFQGSDTPRTSFEVFLTVLQPHDLSARTLHH
jgi:hypothetical protein